MTNITKNFSLEEFFVTNQNILNSTSDPLVLKNIRLLCENVLQPIRDRFGAVYITSGYRCPELNALIGGSKKSQHMFGMAADFVVRGKIRSEIVSWIRSNLEFDQLIEEPGWIHVSYRKPTVFKKNRNMYWKVVV